MSITMSATAIVSRLALSTVGAFMLAGCARYQSGWESVPYVNEAPPAATEARSPADSRERTMLKLSHLTLSADLNNRVRTSSKDVYAFVVPVWVDPRSVNVSTRKAGTTRVSLSISGMRADFVVRPELASLRIGDSTVRSVAAYEFGMWNDAGERVSTGGRYDDRVIAGSLPLVDASRTHIINIDFPIETPSPQSVRIELDLSKALVAPGVPALPLIRFTPSRWKHGST